MYLMLLACCCATVSLAGDQLQLNRTPFPSIAVPPAPANRGIPTPGRLSSSGFDRMSVESAELAEAPGRPQSLSPDTTSCYTQDYFDFAHSFDMGCYWVGTVSMAGGTPYEIGMRFDIPIHHSAEVEDVAVWIGQSTATIAGGCDVVLKVWSNVGGVPASPPLYVDTFDLSGLNPIAWSGGYVTFTLNGGSPLLIENATSYFVTVGAVGDPSDSFDLIVDSPENCSVWPTGRGTWYTGSEWLSLEETFTGGDRNMALQVNQCVYYANDCYRMSGLDGGSGWVSLWLTPDDNWTSGQTMTGFGQRFISEGLDTLKTVTVYHVVDGAVGFPDQSLYGPTGTNGLAVSIWPDDGLGEIDMSSGPLATEVIPGGLSSLFPTTNNNWDGLHAWEVHDLDFSAHNLVLTGPWHVTFAMTGNDPADGQLLLATSDYADGLWGGSVNFTPPDPNWETFGASASWAEGPYGDRAAYVDVTVCRDEFYDCLTRLSYNHPPDWVWGIGEEGFAQRITGLAINRIEEIRFYYEDIAGDGLAGATVNVHLNGGPGSGPGAIVASYPVISSFGWVQVPIPGGLQVTGDFWISVVYDFVAGGNASCVTEFGGVPINGGAWILHGGVWYSLADAFGQPLLEDNLILEVDFCYVPGPPSPYCYPTDWTTVGHDFGRSGHSGCGVADAWCDLTLVARWEHPSFGAQRNGPIIWNSLVVQAFSSGTESGYYVFSLDSLSAGPIDSITTSTHPQDFGGSVRCTPTIAIVDGTPLLFVAGGTANAVGAYDLSSVPGITQRWTANPFNGWLGHNSFVSSIRYGTFVVADQAGSPILYYMDDAANLYAVDASTGAPYSGWSGPFALGNPSYKALTFDGVNLYVATSVPGGYGNVIAIDASDGTYVWDLASGDGLRADGVYTNVTSESFDGGCSVAEGELYVVSAVSGDHPASGVYYKLNAATGNLQHFTQANRQFQSHPVLGYNLCYTLGMFNWASEPATGGTVNAFNRYSGTLTWTSSPLTFDPLETWYRAEGLLTCESPAFDHLLFAFNGSFTGNHGFLSAFSADDGRELFQRRIDHGAGANVGGGGAIGHDSQDRTHVVFVDAWGTLYDLSKGPDRARLQLLTPSATQAVPFGSSYDTVVTFEDMYTNTGCASLLVSLKADEYSNGVTPASPGYRMVATDRDERLAEMASNLTHQLPTVKHIRPANLITNDGDDERLTDRAATNRAASAVPAFLVDAGGGDVFSPPGGGFITAPGDTSDILVRVNGPFVNRGPQSFYVEFTHNDPDYFLNDPSLKPEIRLTLVGGCLTEYVTMEFGQYGENRVPVYNHGRLATGGGPSYVIDGTDGAVYQGTYIYGVDTYRLALNSQDWHGGGEAESYRSMQADPFSGSCTPEMAMPTLIGHMTSDGLTYHEVYGTIVHKAYIDSVENFDDGFGGWDWTLTGQTTFDNALTMGLACENVIVSVLDDTVSADGLLNHVTLEKMTFHERNGNAVPGWKFGAFVDYDIRWAGPTDIGDTAFIDRDVSTAWCADLGNSGVAHGMIKLPFGCGEEPIKNVLALDANYAMFSDAYLDSAYYYMTLPPGDHSHQVDGVLAGTQDDEEWHCTIIEHDWTGHDTLIFGVANFGLGDLPDTYTSDGKITDLAVLTNKLAGFGRGDVNDDGAIGLADIIYLADYVNGAGGKPGPIPFMHCGDLDGTDGVNNGDVIALIEYYFGYGGCLYGAWMF